MDVYHKLTLNRNLCPDESAASLGLINGKLILSRVAIHTLVFWRARHITAIAQHSASLLWQIRHMMMSVYCLKTNERKIMPFSQQVGLTQKPFLPRDAMHARLITLTSCFHTKRHDNIPTRTPLRLTGASNAGGVGKNRDSGRIAGYRSMTGGMQTIATVRQCSLSHRRRRISESLFITACSMDEYAEEKRR